MKLKPTNLPDRVAEEHNMKLMVAIVAYCQAQTMFYMEALNAAQEIIDEAATSNDKYSKAIYKCIL
jgi:uncharacterized protein HemX